MLSSSAASILEVCINARQQRWNWFDPLTKATNDIAREIGEMDPNDPLRCERIKELHTLTELNNVTKGQRNKFIYERMDALAREVGSLKPRDLRRADIVNEIIRLSHLIVN